MHTIRSSSAKIRVLCAGEFFAEYAFELFNIYIVWHFARISTSDAIVFAIAIVGSGTLSSFWRGSGQHALPPYRFAAMLNCVRIAVLVYGSWIYLAKLPPGFLVIASCALAAIRPHFDPAVHGSMQTLALPSAELASVASSHFVSMQRYSRVIAAATFFVVRVEDVFVVLCFSAFLYLISAICFLVLDQLTESRRNKAPEHAEPGSFWRRIYQHDPASLYAQSTFFFSVGMWYAVIVWLTALVIGSGVKTAAPSQAFDDRNAFLLAFSLGSLAGAWLNFRTGKTIDLRSLVYTRIVAAAFYILMSLNTDIYWMATCAFFVALPNPVAEEIFMFASQCRPTGAPVSNRDIFRMQYSMMYAGMLVGVIAAHLLVQVFAAQQVTRIFGICFLLHALFGLVLVRRRGNRLFNDSDLNNLSD
jgi:hypothetical protein